MYTKGKPTPITAQYTYRSSQLSILHAGKECHKETNLNFMSDDDFSHTYVTDGMKITVASRPSKDDQKILFVTVDG